jgi:hypothetical protein
MPQRIYRAWSGEAVIIDDDGSKLTAYINGMEAGYVSYVEEKEDKYSLLSFGYIHVQPAFQKTKLSSLLLFCLAGEALADGLPIIRVTKPDPNLAGYWEHIGFDIRAARKRFYYMYRSHLKNVQEPSETDLKETVAVCAEAPAGRILRLNQSIARSYWDIESAPSIRNETGDWYEWQKEKMIGFNMYEYENSVKPLHDYSSSYID